MRTGVQLIVAMLFAGTCVPAHAATEPSCAEQLVAVDRRCRDREAPRSKCDSKAMVGRVGWPGLRLLVGVDGVYWYSGLSDANSDRRLLLALPDCEVKELRSPMSLAPYLPMSIVELEEFKLVDLASAFVGVVEKE